MWYPSSLMNLYPIYMEILSTQSIDNFIRFVLGLSICSKSSCLDICIGTLKR